MRLQSFLSKAGIASRRSVVSDIQNGKVTVNGEVVETPSFQVDPDHDEIYFDGAPVTLKRKLYFMLNKPKGVISTVEDTHSRQTVRDFFPHVKDRIYPVGRLDQDTTGLLLLTNDGDLTFQLTHPKFGVKKVYEVTLNRKLQERDRKDLEQGVMIGGFHKTSPCTISVLEKHPKYVEITIGEGRKRQVRLMFESLGYEVLDLHRKAYGPLTLKELKPGHTRKLTDHEVELLRRSARNEK